MMYGTIPVISPASLKCFMGECHPSIWEVRHAEKVFKRYLVAHKDDGDMSNSVLLSNALSEVWRAGRKFEKHGCKADESL